MMAVTTSQGDDEVMATINITPFTDVLLVLLIIFIILASVTKEPKLPDAKNTEKLRASQIVVLIDDKDVIHIGSRAVGLAQSRDALQALSDQTHHAFTSVIIKADPHASYGTVLQVMDQAKEEGLTSFGLANHIDGSKTL
jgi:biopolymer transport protein ExbD